MRSKLIILSSLIGLSTCFNGFSQSIGNIELVGKLSITNLPIHDVWGYTDAVTGTRYALLCASTSGLRVIDLSDPTDPQLVGSISGNGVRAIDVKTWQNYAYVVGESLSVSGKIIDLSDPTDPTQVGTFPAAHNITISDDGYMYLSTVGVRIFDLNNDPINPDLVFADNSCDGHDITIVEDILYDFSDDCGTRIFDISTPDTLVSMGAVPSNGMFHHSGWPTENGNHVFVCDELASPSENDITVWDISDLQNPVLVDSFNDPTSYVHNLYAIGNYAFVSYYRAGFRVFDISDPTSISLMAEYDTDSTLSGPGYGGNFGVYPFWGNDMILASDEENGLYIFGFNDVTGISEGESENNSFKIYPNPTNDLITIELENTSSRSVEISISNSVGVLIRKETVDAPTQILNEYYSLSEFPNGIYFIEVTTDNSTQTQKVILNR